MAERKGSELTLGVSNALDDKHPRLVLARVAPNDPMSNAEELGPVSKSRKLVVSARSEVVSDHRLSLLLGERRWRASRRRARMQVHLRRRQDHLRRRRCDRQERKDEE